jgi:SNF2 family DNA or RNA helicase
MEILGANPERQFVIFSQSKQVINLLATRLENAGITHGILTGDTPQLDRGHIVAAFQDRKLRVFAGTIQAGGEGITLTAADTVIFIDRTWSPAKNRQAEDRLHRIGQKNAVQVIDLVAVDTVDGGRLQRIEQSWQYIKRLLGDSDAKKPEGAYI